ncbi:glycosyltransferase family 2 protein [Mongoliitalea daihaiensis]|uniref:glycosyltransferase family 2 protein n=1 Tax=Mongoliitalea daihaiensis TaxID=2782006 RepID=UPI001F193FEC|nr:glycosyltransferase family 2 protein [Mongoliitalea daihaiensis]UJP65993.1 glycosyltransferase family 2 protein [Mongoliitalea daihaiensis]
MPLHNESSVAIIILNWNGYEHSRNCLDSLAKLTYSNFQVLLVDNASVDGSGTRLKEEFPSVIFLQNEQNLGFTGGNNVGITYALEHGFSYVMLLNNDTLVAPDFLKHMVDMLANDASIGIVQPLILWMEDPEKIWSAGGEFQPWLGISKTKGDRAALESYRFSSQALDWVTGCCMLVPSKVIQELGPLQASFFAYFEDVDWSLRIRKAGYQLLLSNESIIYHEGNASSKKASKEGTLSPTVFYLHARNQLFLIRRHLFFPAILLAFGYHLIKYSAWIMYFCFRGRFKKAKAVIKGMKDGLLLDHHVNRPLCP